MTPKQQAAMQQALEALEKTGIEGTWELHEAAITALREVLAEPQEPVAWATEIIDALQAHYDTEMIKEHDSGDALIRLDDAIAAVEDAEKHYTAPPQRKPLTDEEIADVYLEWDAAPGRSMADFARAIEVAHGIKE
jgi:hypothetical protein